MKWAQIEPTVPGRASWRILLAVMVALFVIVVAVATDVGRIGDWIGNPAGNELRDTIRLLTDAEGRIARSSEDGQAHLDRAKAYLVLGHLEGARLEWEKCHETGSAEWGDIARSLDELESKTEEIRSLLHDAETSDSPSEKYPPIYTLLDDIADRFEGVPRYRALFLKGYLLLREGRKAEAEPIFADSLDSYAPLREYVEYNHARSLMVAGSEDSALKELNDFIRDYPSSRLAPLAHLERINLLRDLERTEEALGECARAIDRYPTSSFAPKTLRKWAEIYESAMDFENGAGIRVRLLRDFPESADASETVDMFFGGVYSPGLLSESDRLEVAYSAIDSHPSDAFGILSVLAESGNLTAEDRAKACQGAARCEYLGGRYYECIDWADKARSLAPGTEWADLAGIRKGHAFWSLDKKPLAKEAYWEAARGHGPRASSAAQILYERAFEDSDLATVAEACRYIVEEYPSSAETPAAMTLLAFLGCRDRQYQTALGFAERCRSAFPESLSFSEAGFWRARALEGVGKSAEASAAYETVASETAWSYWGIRARERLGLGEAEQRSLDPFSFDARRMSVYDSALATAWELYDAGVLELAQSEFLVAKENGIPGAQAGLALVYVEQDDLHSGVVALRDAFEAGDEAHLTPARQKAIFEELYPRPFDAMVRDAALSHDIPPSWLWGAMRQESTFNPRAKSSAGAQGLLQIMPETGRFIAAQRGADTFDPATLWDPAVNIDYGAWYFTYLRGQVGGDRLLDIVAAYNAGPGKLKAYRTQLPTRDDDIFVSSIPRWETRKFTQWVYANIRIYEAVLEAQGFELVTF